MEVGEPSTVQAISSRTMQPKPRWNFLSTRLLLMGGESAQVALVVGMHCAESSTKRPYPRRILAYSVLPTSLREARAFDTFRNTFI